MTPPGRPSVPEGQKWIHSSGNQEPPSPQGLLSAPGHRHHQMGVTAGSGCHPPVTVTAGPGGAQLSTLHSSGGILPLTAELSTELRSFQLPFLRQMIITANPEQALLRRNPQTHGDCSSSCHQHPGESKCSLCLQC